MTKTIIARPALYEEKMPENKRNYFPTSSTKIHAHDSRNGTYSFSYTCIILDQSHFDNHHMWNLKFLPFFQRGRKSLCTFKLVYNCLTHTPGWVKLIMWELKMKWASLLPKWRLLDVHYYKEQSDGSRMTLNQQTTIIMKYVVDNSNCMQHKNSLMIRNNLLPQLLTNSGASGTLICSFPKWCNLIFT